MMTHAQWLSKIRRSLAQVERQPARALKSLEQIVSQVRSEAVKVVGDWHVEQTLHMISTVQSQAEEHRESARTMLQIADRHEQHATYYRRAFVSACAAAALELSATGDRAGAARVLRRAAAVAADLRPADKLFRKAQQVVSSMRAR